jgi:hypothetical protein
MSSTKRTARAAMLIGGMLILQGCVTTMASGGTKPPVADMRAVCAGREPIRWSRADTDDTIRQAKAHNAVGRELGCF